MSKLIQVSTSSLHLELRGQQRRRTKSRWKGLEPRLKRLRIAFLNRDDEGYCGGDSHTSDPEKNSTNTELV